MSKTIRTFVLGTNAEGSREILEFQIAEALLRDGMTVELDLAQGDHHQEAIRLATTRGFTDCVAFDETDPAARLIVTSPLAKPQLPRIVIECTAGKAERITVCGPLDLVLMDADFTNPDNPNRVLELPQNPALGAGRVSDFFVNLYATDLDQSSNPDVVAYVTRVFDLVEKASGGFDQPLTEPRPRMV